VINETAI